MFDEDNIHKKAYEIPKDSKLGRKLSWLIEVPCEFWTRREEPEIRLRHCKRCHLKLVCDEHSDAIDEFCKNKDYEVYVSKYFIEIVHK